MTLEGREMLMAEQDSFQMGKREQARRQQRRRRLIVLLICAVVVVFIILCIVFASWYGGRSGQNEQEEEVLTSEEEDEEEDGSDSGDDEEDVELSISDADEEDEDEETEEEEETADADESETDADEEDADDSSSESSTSSSSSSASSTSTSSSSDSTSEESSTSDTTDTTDSTSSTEDDSSTETSAGTIASATLTSPVDSVTVGASGTLSCTVTSSTGEDVTSDSVISYYGTGCTISGSNVYFDTVGTATIYAVITYNDSSIQTNTITIAVARVAMASATLRSEVEKVAVGDTATLTLTVLDENGTDITADCTVRWTAGGGSVSDGTVTFANIGTSSVYATVTYEGVTLTTNSVSFTVTGPLAEVELTCSAEEAEVGDIATLTVRTLDEDGNELEDDISVSYTAENCTVEDGVVTFTDGGTAVITVTATYGSVTLTSEAVTVTVHHTVTMTDEEGEEVTADLTALSQSYVSSAYGWSVSLPEFLTVEESEDGRTVTCTSESLGFTFTFTLTDREEGDTDSIGTLFRARLAELNDWIDEIEAENEDLDEESQTEVPEILSRSYQPWTGTCKITWVLGSTVTAERYYAGEARILTAVAVWDEETFPEGEALVSYILDTLNVGDLDTAD